MTDNNVIARRYRPVQARYRNVSAHVYDLRNVATCNSTSTALQFTKVTMTLFDRYLFIC